MIIGKISLNSKCIRINIDGKYQTKVIAGYNHRPFLATAFQDTFAQKNTFTSWFHSRIWNELEQISYEKRDSV